MKKAAVYCGTGNLYNDMITAAKSLAIHSSVDEIWFLVEHKVFPYQIPDYVHTIDVSKQRFFNSKCPNVYKKWTFMTLMRVTLPKLFPDLDRILSLDVDTIVDRNVDELWDLDLDHGLGGLSYYLAGVPEPEKSFKRSPYVNNGSVIYNLKALREDHIDDKIIELLNTKAYNFAEQDCINEVCAGRILTLSSTYNANNYTEICKEPKIYHFANNRKFRELPIVKQYRNLDWPVRDKVIVKEPSK